MESELGTGQCGKGYVKIMSSLSLGRLFAVLLKVIDPRGVKARQKHRLERREYSVPGPNFIWHMDGYDKLKPYGVCIHGCIDGYSRRIMWLEVSATNKNPRLIVKYFIDCIRQCVWICIRQCVCPEKFFSAPFLYVSGKNFWCMSEKKVATGGGRKF